jgi:hypothetical protein
MFTNRKSLFYSIIFAAILYQGSQTIRTYSEHPSVPPVFIEDSVSQSIVFFRLSSLGICSSSITVSVTFFFDFLRILRLLPDKHNLFD